ncbi:MAG: S1C family serine protease [Patescibacteria group bacterium]
MTFTHQSLAYRLFAFILFVGVSLLSGYVGGLFAIQPLSFEDIQPHSFIIEQPVSKKSDGTLESLYKRTNPIVVSIAVGQAKQRLTNSMIQSFGIILTSDGWIACPKVVNASNENLFAVRSDGSSAPIVRRITDVALGVDFLKMEGTGFGSTDFVSKEQSFEARQSYVVIPRKTIDRILTIRRSYPTSVKDSFIRNSDTLEKAYLTASNDYPNGSPVFTEDAQLLGLFVDSNILPSYYIHDSLERLLRTGTIKRMDLNISYIDLAATPALSQKPQMGALIVADKNGIQLLSKGPRTTLYSGDIITKVNGEEINENQSLSELIAQYTVKDAITLTYLTSDRKEHTVELDGRL